ncbi:hypothetical protein BGLA2_870006 [Burkholderia gladioli]|nr:hypothetical protein BGLA2_870006 [Burkholderia gladioli]
MFRVSMRTIRREPPAATLLFIATSVSVQESLRLHGRPPAGQPVARH